MQKIDLLPCPFCGSITAPTVMNQNEAQWLDNDIDEEDLSMVVCCATRKHGCGASTGFCDTFEQAVKEWNTRASGWIPCSERMPEDDKEVLFAVIYPWDKKTRVTLGRRRTKKSGGSWWSNGYCHFSDYDVTHWMPLPEAPKRKDDTYDND